MSKKERIPSKRKWLRKSSWAIVIIFILMNVVAFFHAYKFTHFTESKSTKTDNPKKLSNGQKLNALIFGVSNPRPENDQTPSTEFETIHLQSNRKIACWSIKTIESKGTVILFHGFSGNKSSLLPQAAIFRELGYNTLLVDFMGSGGSEGNQTTIGFLEAEQVKTCFDYLRKKGEQNIFLFGTSMGAVAIMKSIHDSKIKPKGIILECPFGTMYETVCARFKIMNTPTFPMAGLLVLWGGIQNGFWANSHNPSTYAKKIDCPTLLLHGQKDEKVSMKEIQTIFKNLSGKKVMKIYPDAGHENYLNLYTKKWTEDVRYFLK